MYLRLYLLPIIVFILILALLSVLLFNQRNSELEGVEDLLQLQAGLLAEKISSKLNTFEMTLILHAIHFAYVAMWWKLCQLMNTSVLIELSFLEMKGIGLQK